tara:strand:+ start:8927 stop:9175 length:249 start_codon:yes stop_codon:yes gene_type:complete
MKNTMKNKTKTRYRVYSLGEGIKESNDYFTSLAAAKKFMKTHYNFMIEMNASLFTLCVEKSDDNFNDIWTTTIDTRTTIINL